ncbi:NADP-dependent oxidoreductase [Sphingomonas sp. RB56-2]|uniref:NADP-dependent oxidoreductase n=1 Tax=Sphingomonas brevis TaxID=2908206 RepID=A0ABT0S981_9SPHN|nr:NADP-dependent oxidoreductase [Sphingomonas brevis]MCL6740949.1 NADP-dependent oxidoreductase [Sphingomonas brevis]
MARAWHLMRRPNGMPVIEDFALKDYALPALGEGMARVRNRWLSVDPYMRGRMNDVKSYVPPFSLDAPMSGGAVGEVIESNDPSLAPGDMVLHMSGWRDETIEPASNFNKLPPIPGVEPQAFLGNLGLTGGTAYFGLLDAASAKEGDIVFVSAAAGAVGSAVVQIAKAKGMTVIGSAGGADKCDFVQSLGADAVIDYKAGSLVKQLAGAAPDGIDVYFDNVGGDHLDAALALARKDARFAICGMIDIYNEAQPTSLRYIARIIAMRIRLKGFIYTDYMGQLGDFYRDMGGWLASGQVKSRDTVVEGLDQTLDAFLGLFKGANTGKMLVRL